MNTYSYPTYRRLPDAHDTAWTDVGFIPAQLTCIEQAYEQLVEDIERGKVDRSSVIAYNGPIEYTVAEVEKNLIAWYQFYETMLYKEI